MTTVTVKFGNHCEVAMPNDCFEATGGAEATGRVMGHPDLVEYSEWCKFGKITATRYYVFDLDNVGRDTDPEDYPWKSNHVDRIEVDEDILDME